MDTADIWRAAQILIEKHGASAADWARNRQLDMLGQHDILGHAIWGRIAAAIDELQREERRDGEKVN
jgi:hypothetical protein